MYRAPRRSTWDTPLPLCPAPTAERPSKEDLRELIKEVVAPLLEQYKALVQESQQELRECRMELQAAGNSSAALAVVAAAQARAVSAPADADGQGATGADASAAPAAVPVALPLALAALRLHAAASTTTSRRGSPRRASRRPR